MKSWISLHFCCYVIKSIYFKLSHCGDVVAHWQRSRLLRQWSRNGIRYLSQRKTLRKGRVTVCTVKSRETEGNLHLRPKKGDLSSECSRLQYNEYISSMHLWACEPIYCMYVQEKEVLILYVCRRRKCLSWAGVTVPCSTSCSRRSSPHPSSSPWWTLTRLCSGAAGKHTNQQLKDLYRREAKGRRCCLWDRLYLIPCCASCFALGQSKEYDKLHQDDMKKRVNSSYYILL